MSAGQRRLDLVDLLADLHADDVELLAPVELELELGAVGVEVAWSFLIPDRVESTSSTGLVISRSTCSGCEFG